MKPLKKHEMPPRVWNFVQRFVPESLRGMAAVELMDMVQAAGKENVRTAVYAAATGMRQKMQVITWKLIAGVFGIGFLFGTLFYYVAVKVA